jgi:hypothetical protein
MQSSNNRIRRITFMVGPTRTAAHLDNKSSGSKEAYDAVRDATLDPDNVQVVKRETYKTEED